MDARVGWIDRWRGILIFQIVAFHVIGVARHFQAEGDAADVLTIASGWLERYHVVAFFALMGVVWRRKDSFREFLARKVRRLLVPYFVFGGLWALCFAVLVRRFACAYVEIGDFAWWQPFASVLLCNGYPGGMGARVVNALWFLPCMFGVSLVYFGVDRHLPGRRGQLLLLPPLYALHGVLAGTSLPWGLDRLPLFLMFVILARWTIPRAPLAWIGKHGLWGVPVALALYAFAECRPFIQAGFGRMGIGAWAGVFGAWVMIGASVLLAQSVRWKALEATGRDSLGILVLHKFPILAIQAVPLLRETFFGGGGGAASLFSGFGRRDARCRRGDGSRPARYAVGAWRKEENG